MNVCEVQFCSYHYDLEFVDAEWNAALARSCSKGLVKHYFAESVVGKKAKTLSNSVYPDV